jgi:hypothetical protein
MGAAVSARTCAACGNPSEGKRSIHRDGFGEGPEVWLCNACGMHETPTLEELWARIAERIAAGHKPSEVAP